MVFCSRPARRKNSSLLSFCGFAWRRPGDMDALAICEDAGRGARQRQASDGFLFEFETVGGDAMNTLIESPGIRDVPEIETQSEIALPPIVDAAEFMAQKITPPTELVSGILHQGSKMVLGGGSKTFKTWTLLDLGISV